MVIASVEFISSELDNFRRKSYKVGNFLGLKDFAAREERI